MRNKWLVSSIIVVWELGPVGLGWVSYLVGWVGFGLMKWTHGQHWVAVSTAVEEEMENSACITVGGAVVRGCQHRDTRRRGLIGFNAE